MKIGTFARKFNLNISTIRFYINNGLLSPCKVGGQYEFDEECVRDMSKILKYKQFNFSLEEIQLLFFMEKASHYNDDVVIDVCADLLKSKRKGMLEERDQLVKSIVDIEREIANLPTSSKEERPPGGVPFPMLPYLYCPQCQIPLKLDDASLCGGSLQKGILSCDCGYEATIHDGIIFSSQLTEETPFKAFENIESVMAMKDQFSPTYRKFVAKSYNWMYNQIASELGTPRYIMAGPFTFNFLLEYIERLGKKHTYVVFDPSLKRINKFKQYLPIWSYNIAFIVGEASHLPLKKETMDFFIDDYSTTNSLFTYGTFATESLAPFIKPGGEIAGIFTSYPQAPKSLHNFKKDHPTFHPEKMTLSGLKYHWSLEKIDFIEKKLIGSSTPNEVHFPQNALGEPIDIYGYHAKKTGRTNSL